MASGLMQGVRSTRAASPAYLSVVPPPVIPPARWPRQQRGEQRLLVLDTTSSSLADHELHDLGELLTPGDLLVFNDAATLPASLAATTPRGARLELRLARERAGEFWAVVLGEGDFRTRTEARKPPPPLRLGEVLTLAQPLPHARPLTARVVDLAPLGTEYSHEHPLISLEFAAEGAALWDALYRAGRPIQYSYVERPLDLWHVQNVFSSRPWAFELPSAAHGFTWELLLSLSRRGIRRASLTHAAGISSTGSAQLDRRLPFPERYEIPEATADEVERARHDRRRVVAVGTTVVRALESAWVNGRLRSGPGDATLVLGRQPSRRPRVVDSVISGIHQAGESHYSLLGVFAEASLLARAEAHALESGYRAHEFGDACLVLGNPGGDSAPEVMLAGADGHSTRTDRYPSLTAHRSRSGA